MTLSSSLRPGNSILMMSKLSLDKLRNAGLSVNMKKSKLFRTSLKFLGHIVSATGVHVDPDKIEAMQNFPAPTNLKALQRFLGMAGWHHRFVPNFSQIAEPTKCPKEKRSKIPLVTCMPNSFYYPEKSPG